jgi:hypothetical protein
MMIGGEGANELIPWHFVNARCQWLRGVAMKSLRDTRY